MNIPVPGAPPMDKPQTHNGDLEQLPAKSQQQANDDTRKQQAPDDEPLPWDSVNKNGIPKRSCANARIAIGALNIRCGYDEFHDRLLIDGPAIASWAGEVSDYVCQVLRDQIFERFRFDPGKEHLHDAVVQLCLRHRFNPITDYLDGLRWDGTPRLDSWLSCYLSAEDTVLNRAIGRLTLVAAVRRVRDPGCKFDQIVVLEGKEGTMKSTAIELLAGKPNFSDQSILGMKDREQQECLKGCWLYEIADLSGMRKAEVEHVKAFASRTHDRARPAYGRFRIDQPRRCVLFATTNDDTYLKSQTGNRRFWPVRTDRIDIEALHRDRDQLWAEAAQIEATGLSLVLPGELWPRAQVEQDKRLERDPWDDLLVNVKGDVHPNPKRNGYEERVANTDLLTTVLGLKAEKIHEQQGRRLAYCMRRLGWDGPRKMRIRRNEASEKPVWGYWRPIQNEEKSVPDGEEPVPDAK